MSAHEFSPDEIDAVYRAIAARRDMRHFIERAVDADVLARLLAAAHRAPSVGYMQPWRFIRVVDRGLRSRLRDLVENERQRTAVALGEAGNRFMQLKIDGLDRCGEVLVVALTDGRSRHVFGRRTMPEMDLASAACAIQNMWLAARAEGLGMGWVSMFEPADVAALFDMPDGARPIAILCLGHVDAFYDRPMLEAEGWAERLDLERLVGRDGWPVPDTRET
ncbi:5,6-dimethylbenzimidazole synthase [Salinisphaera sp. Q1T1-3]|uniref:5,6-dimethylbenzimidazole synthase n=1 Tax=Salinisphaera sp. Q1T1-3 TaxID=2321229 RepID=UPI000E75BD6A|nr:5,6-dimethylbenzimidazole synthase [Salinisphaera sp. Q1T1-3]RJS95107.1 5,6-dimethylbenzimidazole synthase [Salinisphaera sp. Q1T1-3]